MVYAGLELLGGAVKTVEPSSIATKGRESTLVEKLATVTNIFGGFCYTFRRSTSRSAC